MYFKDKAKQQQDDRTGRTHQNCFQPFDAKDSFFPPFCTDLFVDGKGLVKFVKVRHRNYLLYLAVLLATCLG